MVDKKYLSGLRGHREARKREAKANQRTPDPYRKEAFHVISFSIARVVWPAPVWI
jgi:hypothetical protein